MKLRKEDIDDLHGWLKILLSIDSGLIAAIVLSGKDSSLGTPTYPVICLLGSAWAIVASLALLINEKRKINQETKYNRKSTITINVATAIAIFTATILFMAALMLIGVQMLI